MEFKESERMAPFSLIDHEMAELKEIVLNRLSSIESALKEAGASVATEAQRAREIKRSLEAEVEALEAKLKEKEELLHARESAMKKLEESLTGKVHELENRVREKDQLLESRDAELKEMRLFLNRIREKESALNQAEALTERIKESLKADVSRLEAQLIEKEDIPHAQESARKELGENLTAKLHELENRVRREGILESGEAEGKGS